MKQAVLILGFGGPTSLDQVRPFIERVVAGRNVPAERVDTVVEQYKIIGGKSPFNELTEKQAQALHKCLGESGKDIPVVCGFLHAPPFIADTVKDILPTGVERLIVVIVAPHRSEASYDRYLNALQLSLEALGAAYMPVQVVEAFHTNALFIEAVAERVKAVTKTLNTNDKYRLIFTAHSMPQAMSDRSSYAGQIEESAALVADLIGHNDFRVAFQSRSGNPRDPWLGPDVASAIEQAKADGINNVVVVPIGFVCDHVEVLYDLDVLAQSAAKKSAVTMLRAGTVSDHPKFIQMLSQLVDDKLKQAV